MLDFVKMTFMVDFKFYTVIMKKVKKKYVFVAVI